MLLAQSSGDWGTLFFWAPLWAAIALWLIISHTFDYLRKIRERQMASEIVQSMLANPKTSAEDIERVLAAWWGGHKAAAKAAKMAREFAASGAQPVKASV
ncbi:MAG TPA: hypothetical protein VFB96_17675 [Pirellulaceae bacterium]|nr:hypothetical protein [Pirellulaceae bacterium]